MNTTPPAAPFEVRRIDLAGHQGLRLAADVAGPTDGPPVLLLHGGGQTRHAWRRGLSLLAGAGWRAIALDARGHGDSAWPQGPGDDLERYGVDALCGDLREVLATLARTSPVRPVIVGASMGGHTALITEGESPGLARALVLVDVVPQLEAEGVRRILDFMTARPDGFASLDEAADAVAAYNPSRPRPRDPAGLVRNLRLGEDGRWRWHWDPRFIATDPVVSASRVAEIRARMAQAAAAVRVPTLLVRGADSDVVRQQGVDDLRRRMSGLADGLEVVTVPGAGHMVAGDRNDPFARAMLDFLLRQAGSAAGLSP